MPANFPLAFGKDWWLPVNYAVHGRETDALFSWFFWITLVVLIAVQATIVIFVIQFRQRASHTRARPLHGNTKLELIWTAIPALIIGSLAYGSERVWHDYRSSPDLNNPNRSKILVIGQQFKWNVIYPGPDGKFGRYLIYPKPTDTSWPIGPNGKPTRFGNVPGPASLPYKQALSAINTYIATENPMGKDFSDPDGKDDDCDYQPGRPIYVPVNRPVEVQLESMDVIHDFFLPNFRAQLYAVPGMRGRFVFTPTVTTRALEAATSRTLSINDLISTLTNPANSDLTIDIDSASPGAQKDKTGWRYVNAQNKRRPSTIIRDGMAFADGVLEKLQAAGILQVRVHKPQPFEIACAQLCGAQHYKMRGELIVLTQEEFDQRFPSAPHGKGN